MFPPNRLGFALKKLIADYLGIVLPNDVPSAEVCEQFVLAMSDFDSDLAWCSRSSLEKVLAFAQAASPDPDTAAAIAQVQSDIELPATP